jgi:hypothetical protein
MSSPAADTEVRLPAPRVTFSETVNGRLKMGLPLKASASSMGIWLSAVKPSTMLPSGAHSVPCWLIVCASSTRAPPADRGAVATPFWRTVSVLSTPAVVPVDISRNWVELTG